MGLVGRSADTVARLLERPGTPSTGVGAIPQAGRAFLELGWQRASLEGCS